MLNQQFVYINRLNADFLTTVSNNRSFPKKFEFVSLCSFICLQVVYQLSGPVWLLGVAALRILLLTFTSRFVRPHQVDFLFHGPPVQKKLNFQKKKKFFFIKKKKRT